MSDTKSQESQKSQKSKKGKKAPDISGYERIAALFNEQVQGSEPLLMTHVVGGYPDLERSEEIVIAMADAGADIVELQIPFSDPIADGSRIVAANTRAVAAGVTPDDVLAMCGRINARRDLPLLIMSYLNPVYTYGAEAFIRKAAAAGAAGLIIPDLPPEEQARGGNLLHLCREAGLAFVPLVAPGTDRERMQHLLKTGFSPLVYAVLRLGVTGRETEVDESLKAYFDMIRSVAPQIRIAGGFGIRSRMQIEKLRGLVDCAVVGSAVLARVDEELAGSGDVIAAVRNVIFELKTALP